MKIVITGASGTLGRYLVGDLIARGAQVLLVGRQVARINTLFPSLECCTYEDLIDRAKGFDGLLHLAALNNNVDATHDEFLLANVALTKSVLEAAKQAGIPRFVYVSTIQALDPNTLSSYASSKRIASEHVLSTEDIDTRVLYPSAIIGEKLSGRLGVLNGLPGPLRALLLRVYGALTPVADISAVSAQCWQAVTKSDFPRGSIVTRDQSENIAFGVIKRGVDIIAAFGILIPFSWLIAIIWLAIKLQSPGPGIFAQKRVGRSGQIFTCYKFRTMAEGSPNVGTHEVHASLVTPFGKFLRRTKLDELPQAINILLNQMSLVGPRPSLPNQDAVIEERNKLGVLAIKPGITGLAQVNKVDMSQPALLAQWDAQYLKLTSLRLDVSILIKTVLGRGGGDAMDVPAKL